MLASLRPFLRFIDLDSTFNAHGFVKKVNPGILNHLGLVIKLSNRLVPHSSSTTRNVRDVSFTSRSQTILMMTN
jgi:hypothetical protein